MRSDVNIKERNILRWLWGQDWNNLKWRETLDKIFFFFFFCSTTCAREGGNGPAHISCKPCDKKGSQISLGSYGQRNRWLYLVSTQWQLILGHASVVSAGTNSGQMPAQKCLEVLISALSKLSTAKMEKTISLRWEHGEPECKFLWEFYLQTRSLEVHMHRCAHIPLRAWSKSDCFSVHTCILQAVSHWRARNWFRVSAKLQQGVGVVVPSFLCVSCERKWRAKDCLVTPAFQMINPNSPEPYQHVTDAKLPSYRAHNSLQLLLAASALWCVSVHQCPSNILPRLSTCKAGASHIAASRDQQHHEQAHSYSAQPEFTCQKMLAY